MAKVKYGLIGFGGIAENRVAKEGYACDKNRFAPLQFAELVAATDINQGRKEAAEALGLKWFASADEMLADPEIQAVYIATNNTTHVPLAMKALNAGKHVISEKPMATNSADAKALVALAKEKGLSLGVDHMMVYNAWNVKAESMIKAGELGNINDSCFHMEFAYGYDPAEAATWRCSKIEEMGGPIGDVASHCFYVSEFIFGSRIVEISCCYLPKTMGIVAEDGAYIKFTMANGMKGSVKVAFSEPRGGLIGTLSNLGYEIYGTEGVLRSYGSMFQLSGKDDEPYKIRLEMETAAGVRKLHPRSFPNIYQSLIEHHAESVLAGKAINARDGLRNLLLCEAAHKSAQQGGKAVKVK